MPADCAAIVVMLEAKRKLNDALGWVERGLAMRDARSFQSDGRHDLAGMRRAMLEKLGRMQEALDSAWGGVLEASGYVDVRGAHAPCSQERAPCIA